MRSLLLFLLWTLPCGLAFTSFQSQRLCAQCRPLEMKKLSREDEIRRKILNLKRQGKISDSPTPGSSPKPSYEDKVKEKLGKKKSQMLGFSDDDDQTNAIQAELDSEDEEAISSDDAPQPQGRIGPLPELQDKSSMRYAPQEDQVTSDYGYEAPNKPLIDPDLFDEDSEPEMSEEDLVDLVSRRLNEKQQQQADASNPATLSAASASAPSSVTESSLTESTLKQTTSGVGGTWTKDDKSNSTEYYKPKSGSWGAFPRPKDISKAYGGGRRVGAGYSKEDQEVADLATKEKLQRYREKVGIDVPSEKEHAVEIEEALQLGQLAMLRGVYAIAVAALEKVTPWCSTNSKVGSKVFLELAMAYEAVGRNQEAYQVYQTLSTCRMEDVKHNAKRLMYGMEAMEIMRDISSEFSRKKIKNTFIDATGLGNIAQNFDDVYQTAYIDLDAGFYKRLTESVVRSNREALQILLKATGKGEVGRMKIVQALRSIARQFDDALENEIAANTKVEPTAIMNGKPIISAVRPAQVATAQLSEFVLASSKQMIENLGGTWQLQLLADKKGDGVSYFNTTRAVQEISTEAMTFSASGPAGFLKIEQSGELAMDSTRRILSRVNLQTSVGGGIFGVFGSKETGFPGAVSGDHQIMAIDSVLLITKCAPGRRTGNDAEKHHFSVWRRMQEP